MAAKYRNMRSTYQNRADLQLQALDPEFQRISRLNTKGPRDNNLWYNAVVNPGHVPGQSGVGIDSLGGPGVRDQALALPTFLMNTLGGGALLKGVSGLKAIPTSLKAFKSIPAARKALTVARAAIPATRRVITAGMVTGAGATANKGYKAFANEAKQTGLTKGELLDNLKALLPRSGDTDFDRTLQYMGAAGLAHKGLSPADTGAEVARTAFGGAIPHAARVWGANKSKNYLLQKGLKSFDNMTAEDIKNSQIFKRIVASDKQNPGAYMRIAKTTAGLADSAASRHIPAYKAIRDDPSVLRDVGVNLAQDFMIDSLKTRLGGEAVPKLMPGLNATSYIAASMPALAGFEPTLDNSAQNSIAAINRRLGALTPAVSEFNTGPHRYSYGGGQPKTINSPYGIGTTSPGSYAHEVGHSLSPGGIPFGGGDIHVPLKAVGDMAEGMSGTLGSQASTAGSTAHRVTAAASLLADSPQLYEEVRASVRGFKVLHNIELTATNPIDRRNASIEKWRTFSGLPTYFLKALAPLVDAEKKARIRVVPPVQPQG